MARPGGLFSPGWYYQPGLKVDLYSRARNRDKRRGPLVPDSCSRLENRDWRGFPTGSTTCLCTSKANANADTKEEVKAPLLQLILNPGSLRLSAWNLNMRHDFICCHENSIKTGFIHIKTKFCWRLFTDKERLDLPWQYCNRQGKFEPFLMASYR